MEAKRRQKHLRCWHQISATPSKVRRKPGATYWTEPATYLSNDSKLQSWLLSLGLQAITLYHEMYMGNPNLGRILAGCLHFVLRIREPTRISGKVALKPGLVSGQSQATNSSTSRKPSCITIKKTQPWLIIYSMLQQNAQKVGRPWYTMHHCKNLEHLGCIIYHLEVTNEREQKKIQHSQHQLQAFWLCTMDRIATMIQRLLRVHLPS